MGGTPVGDTPGQGAPQAAGDKIAAAFALLTSAFDDAHVDSEVLDREDLLAQIAASQHVLNTAFAVQAARLAQAAAREDVRFPDHTSPLGFREHEVKHPIGAHQDQFIGCEIGPLLGWTSGQAIGRVDEAADMMTRTPRLFARVGTGEIEPAKLATIHRAIGRTLHALDTDSDDGQPVGIDLARKVETALLGDVAPEDDSSEAAAIVQANVDLIAAQSTGRLQHRTQRILAALDPVSAGKAARRRRRDRISVFAHPDEEPGLTHLHAILDSATAAKLMAAVEQLARDLHDDTTTNKTFAECKADALADLVLANASITTQLVIQIPIHTGADSRNANSSDSGATTAAGSSRGSAFWPAAGPSHRGGACWPLAFTHPITGLTLYPKGQPPAARAAAGTGSARTSSTGVRIRSQAQLDAEFNELMKTLYPPDPDDYPPGMFDQEHPPTDAEEPDDGPPAWWQPEPSRPSVPSGPHNATQQPCTTTTARLGDGVVPGIGSIPASVIQEMTRSFGTVITRALINADTGITLETCETQYRPSPRLAHFIRTRDTHCRFPNCDRPARYCDIDHLTPWPLGPTAASNLHCLCRHHHRTKQEQHWNVTMTASGVCTWTSPSGRTYTTHPAE